MLSFFPKQFSSSLSSSLKRGYHSVIMEKEVGEDLSLTVLPILEDNYMYLLHHHRREEVVVIDPASPSPALSHALHNRGNCYTLSSILTTHHHWDHAGGNEEILQTLHSKGAPPPEVYGYDDGRIPGLTHAVKDCDTFNLFGGQIKVKTLFTPCHTSGHVCFYMETPNDSSTTPLLFSGDTLFFGGCGRFFEGTATQMYNSLQNITANCDDTCHVLSGHEYTLGNLKYAMFLEPDNEDLKEVYRGVQFLRQGGIPSVLSCFLGGEKKYNPFLRVESEGVKRAVEEQKGEQLTPVEVMRRIRHIKDNWKP